MLQADGRVGIVGLVNDLLKTVVGDDVQAINSDDASAFAVWQTQASSDALLDQRARIGGTQWNDGIEVGDVPAFLEHVDVNDNLNGIVVVLDGQQLLDSFLFPDAGIDLNDLVGVAALEKGIRLDQGRQFGGVRGVARDY